MASLPSLSLREPLPATVEEPLALLSPREPQLSGNESNNITLAESPQEARTARSEGTPIRHGLLSLREPLSYGHRLSQGESRLTARRNELLRAIVGVE